MKKGILASFLASALMLVGTITPTIVQANTTTVSEISYSMKGIVTTNRMSYLYALNNGNFKLVTNRGLAANTPWFFDQSVKGADGITYYRVSTNEWVGSNSLGSIKGKAVTPTNTNTNNNSNSNSHQTDTSPIVTTDGKIIGNSDSHIYHVPGQASYNIKSSHAVYFNSEQEAINAGYTRAKR